MAFYQFNILTNAGGAWSETISPTPGILRQYRYVPDGTAPLDTATDLNITGAHSGFSYVSIASLGTSAVQRVPTHATSDGGGTARLYAESGAAVAELMAVAEPVTVAITNGASAKKGTLYLWID